MARTSLQDVRGLADPLLSYNFDLFFPRMPGGGDGRAMTIKCMTTALPGMEIEQETASLHGIEVSYGGRQIWTKSFTATFIETRDSRTRTDIRNWIEYARNNSQNSGHYKNDYAVDAVIFLYDDIPNIINEVKVVGCWPKNLAEYSFDGAAGTIMQCSVEWSFDFTEENK